MGGVIKISVIESLFVLISRLLCTLLHLLGSKIGCFRAGFIAGALGWAGIG